MNHHDIATIRTKDNEDMELEDLKNRPSDLMETILEIELDGIQNQILSYSIEGFKGNEIAEKLGVSTSTISKELNEVREKIRKEIF
jgi:DNA-directed RNA polymerase specialized sigma24 family protein